MTTISLGEQVEQLKLLRAFGFEAVKDFDWEDESWLQVEIKPDGLPEKIRSFQPKESLWIVRRSNSATIFYPEQNEIGSVVLEGRTWHLVPVSDDELRTQLRAELAH